MDLIQESDFVGAVKCGDLKIVKAYLEQPEANPNACGDGKTVFQIALQEGFTAIAELIMAAEGYQINTEDANPLSLSIDLGYLNIAEKLLERGANPDFKDKDEMSVFFKALIPEHFELAKKMLEAGAAIDSRDKNGWTPLIWASIKGYQKIVSFLIEHGANVHICNNDGWNALTGAYFKRQKSIINLLLEAGASFGPKYAEAALLSAYQNGYLDVVETLIDMGVNVNVVNKDNVSLLAQAVERGDRALVVKLLEGGADPNVRTKDSLTVLSNVAKAGDCELIKLLLEKGASVNLPSSTGKTPLFEAAAANKLEAVTLLLESGAYINATTNNGISSLMWAAYSGYTEIVKVLLANGANTTLKGGPKEEEKTAKAWARAVAPRKEYPKTLLESNYLEIIKLLTLPGAIIDA